MSKRALKDWYVNVDPINKDASTYQKYLLSKKRHPNQEIVQLGKNTVPYLKADLMLWNETFTKRGQKAYQNAVEMVVSLPFDLEDDEWIALHEFAMQKAYEHELTKQGVSKKNQKVIISKLLSRIYRVRHRKDHIHTMIPSKFFHEKMRITFDFSKLKVKQVMKDSVNEWLEKNKGISKYTYMVNEEQQKFNSQKKARESNDKKIVSELDKELERISKEIELLIERSKEITNEKNKAYVDKQLSTAQKQVKNGNSKRAQSTVNRVNKAIATPNPTRNLFR